MQLAGQQLRALLVTTDFTESDGTGHESVRFLESAGCRGALASGLGGLLFPRNLTVSGLAGCLFSMNYGVGMCN